MDSLGPKIKQLRLKADLNKAALARKVGVSDVTISYWESGAIKQIGHARLVALAEALDCPLSQLLTSDDVGSSSALYLYGKPPAPWLAPNANRIVLPVDLISRYDWHGDCYLVTPAPGEHFDFLDTGDLAAFGPTDACDEPGHYLIEGENRLYIDQLEMDAGLKEGDRVVGRLLARWRQHEGR
ncbi:helix-turn-helix domain-containing protein [Billgrantia pellis]|uniref:helix-turn-helix domain-containing protein n=1 Tax=Billgrantia pellis TaxID=2606936 RepID=UPI001E3C7F1E|nr:helix-turn-helix transcriptional regulator [Halomonas pellis]